MCARIAAASAARSSLALATKRHKMHKTKAEKNDFSVILEPRFLILCSLCAFLRPAFNNKYASGGSADVNGIAAHAGPAILWPHAIATPAPMDDRVGRLGW